MLPGGAAAGSGAVLRTLLRCRDPMPFVCSAELSATLALFQQCSTAACRGPCRQGGGCFPQL